MFCGRYDSGGGGADEFSVFGQQAYDGRVKLPTQGVVHRLQLQIDERVVQVGHPASIELIAKTVPRLFSRSVEFAPIEKDMAMVGMQVQGQAVLRKAVGPAQVLKACQRVTNRKDGARAGIESEAVHEAL